MPDKDDYLRTARDLLATVAIAVEHIRVAPTDIEMIERFRSALSGMLADTADAALHIMAAYDLIVPAATKEDLDQT